jgi:hypothetical protein
MADSVGISQKVELVFVAGTKEVAMMSFSFAWLRMSVWMRRPSRLIFTNNLRFLFLSRGILTLIWCQCPGSKYLKTPCCNEIRTKICLIKRWVYKKLHTWISISKWSCCQSESSTSYTPTTCSTHLALLPISKSKTTRNFNFLHLHTKTSRSIDQSNEQYLPRSCISFKPMIKM